MRNFIKNNTTLNTKNRNLVFGFLITLVLGGLLIPMMSVQAQAGVTYYDASHPPVNQNTGSGACTGNGVGTTIYVTYMQCHARYYGPGYRWVPSAPAEQGLCIPPGSNGTITLAGPNPYNSAEGPCVLAGGSWDGTRIIQNGRIVPKNPTTPTPTPADTKGTCYFSKDSTFANANNGATAGFPYTKKQCTDAGSNEWKAGDWTAGATDPTGATPPGGSGNPSGGTTQTVDKKGDDLYSRLPTCSITTNAGWSGCILVAAYWIIYSVPMSILLVVGYLFNAMLSMTLSTVLYNNNFIPEAWRIVRDFSNIFFILILLYVAIKMILGLGGAEVKKMIAQVVVVALLINFSMFFTKIVIDASNILALIFYNKITIKVNGKETNYKPTLDVAKTGVPEKDFAGGIVGAFDPSKGINEKTFKGAENSYLTLTNIILGASAGATAGLSLLFIGAGSINVGLYLMVIVVAAIIALFASYALFIASIAFMGRLIELWLCIIFSPFAFMSLTVPKLKGIDYLGWDAWLKRLLSVAFMAPIFMFFLLLISKIIQAPVFKNIANEGNLGMGGSIMLIVIPAIIYITLLWKATEFAKKGGGEFAQAFIKYGQMAAVGVGALAIGAATGGAGLAATATLGRAGAAIASSGGLKAAEAAGGARGFLAGKLRDVGSFASKSSFDVRKAPGVGSLLKSAGIKTEPSGLTKAMGLSTEGGFEKRKKDYIERRQERAKSLEVGENEPAKQAVRDAENVLDTIKNDRVRQDALVRLKGGDATAPAGTVANMGLGTLERNVASAERAVADAERALKDAVAEFGATSVEANTARATQATAIAARNTDRTNLEARQAAIRLQEGPIHRAEDALKLAENAVIDINRQRRIGLADSDQNSYVTFITSGGAAPYNVRRESSNQIRRNTQQSRPVDTGHH